METDFTYGKGMVLKHIGVGSILGVFVVALLMGCSGRQEYEKPAEKPMFIDEWKEKAEASPGYSPGREKSRTSLRKTKQSHDPAKVAKPTAPSIKAAWKKPLPTDEINMKMHDVHIAVLLKALARIANQNIMINDNVKGTASINIKSAPWNQVFEGILKTNGLDYKWERDIIRIVTVEDLRTELELQKETQSYELRLQEFKRDMNSLRIVNEPMVTRVIPINYSDLESMKETVEVVLSARRAAAEAEAGDEAGGGPEGEVMMDEHSHSLVIHARTSDMENLESLIVSLDKPTPQIRIEAHVVEATQKTARDLGVQWGGLYLNASGNNFNWVGAQAADTGQTLYDSSANPNFLQPSTDNIVESIPAKLIEGAAGALAYQYQKAGIGVLSVQLKALQEDGELNILSSPSITTVDNQLAWIEAGKEYPYQTVEDGEVKIEFKDAVLRLDVTPHVIDNRILRLKIETKNDELDFTTTTSFGQPAITTKKAVTTVFLYDGQTTVIGGLSKKNISNIEAGVPGLKEVPMLGFLFKGESKSKEFQDLLIFITPYILKERIAVGGPQEPVQ